MSFSSKVKDELSRQLSPARHCQIAETAAIISFFIHFPRFYQFYSSVAALMNTDLGIPT